MTKVKKIFLLSFILFLGIMIGGCGSDSNIPKVNETGDLIVNTEISAELQNQAIKIIFTITDKNNNQKSQTIFTKDMENKTEVVFDNLNKGEWSIEIIAYDENDNKIVSVNKNASIGVDATTKTDVILKTINVTGVSLEQNKLSLVVGQSSKLTASIKPNDATNKNVSWISSDESIATVDNKGNIKAVAAGKIEITINTDDGNFTDTCALTVTESTVDITGVRLDHDTLNLIEGENLRLEAALEPTGVINQNVSWNSSNESVATVDNDGNVTAIDVGEADITVTTNDGGFTDTCIINVSEPPVDVTGVSLNQNTMELLKEDTSKLVAKVEPSDATNKSVTWSSSNESVATVDNDGNVTAIAVGEAEITVTTQSEPTFNDRCKITVTNLSNIFKFNASTGTITDYNVDIGGKEVIIPSVIDGVTVVSIGDDAFKNKGLTSVVIPKSITSIGYSAFEDNLLSSIVIPDSVTFVDNWAFHNNNLSSAVIGNRITSIGVAVFASNNLTSIDIPNSITSIGDAAFRENSLESIIIPDSIISIGESAFAINNLTSLSIPNSVTSIRGYAFRLNDLISVEIGNNVTSIGDGTFHLNNLTEVVIPDSVTSIGLHAFQSNNLTSIVIPDSVTSIGDYAFGDNDLTSVEIGDSVTSIGYYAFRDNNLTSVMIPDSVAFIGSYAFDENVDLINWNN